MAKFRADPFPQKVDLGVGVYRDLARQYAGARLRAPGRARGAGGANHQVLRGGRRPRGIQHRRGGSWCSGPRHPARRDRRARTAADPRRLRCAAGGRGTHPRRRAHAPWCISAIRPGAITRPCWAARAASWSAIPTTMPTRASAALRRHARAPGAGAAGRRGADPCLLPQPHRRRPAAGAVAGAGATAAAPPAGALPGSGLSGIRRLARSRRAPACAWSPSGCRKR